MKLSDIIKQAQSRNIEQDDLIDEIWETSLSQKEKVVLSLQLFDLQPTYHVLANMWLNYFVSDQIDDECNKIIFEKYQSTLSNSEVELSDSMEYSLFFEIFQEDREEINIKAWNYFLNNNPNEKFLKILLINAAPIPFHLKYNLYQMLLANKSFHADIYRSIGNCGTYVAFYNVEFNKQLALEIIGKLDIQDQITKLDSETIRWKYDELISFLKTGGNKKWYWIKLVL